MKPPSLILTLAGLLFPTLSFADPMKFYSTSNGGNCSECEWTVAVGEITEDTPSDFSEFLAREGLIGYIVLDSSGGDEFAAMELGRLIRETGASTTVGRMVPNTDNPPFELIGSGGECLEACMIAFLGGTERLATAAVAIDGATSNLRIGHFQGSMLVDRLLDRSFTGDDRLAAQAALGTYITYLEEMGVSPELYTVVSRLQPGQTLALDEVNAAQLRVLTSDEVGTPWELVVLGRGLAARSTKNVAGESAWLACLERDKSFHVLRGFRTDQFGPTGTIEPGPDGGSVNDFPLAEFLRSAEEMQKDEFGRPLEIFSRIAEYYIPDVPGDPADFVGAFGDAVWGEMYDFEIAKSVVAEIIESSEIMFYGDGGRVSHGYYISLSWRAEAGQTDDFMEILAKNCVR